MLTGEQLELRKLGIGGSEIAAIAGMNPWASPFDIYMRKKGLVSDSSSFDTERGQFFEPAIIEWYKHRTKRNVNPCPTLQHKEHPIVIATPDGISIQNDVRGLEVKAPNWRTAEHWGESGTDQIPDYYVPQTMWEAAVLGVNAVDVAALIDGDLRIYTIAHSPKLFEALVDIAERFWRDHIVADNPPPPDGSQRARDWLTKRYPRVVHDLMDATEEMQTLARLYVECREREKIDAEAKDIAGNRLRALIGDRQGAIAEGVKITWTNNKDSVKTDWQALAMSMGATPELIAKYTSNIPGARVLRVNVKQVEA